MPSSALVIGGTGPTGPGVVHGLLNRGFDVTILHGGQHEADLPGEVAHIHVDPHFAETLSDGLGERTFDLVVGQYGRLKVVVDVLRGRTERLVAIGGATGSVASPHDPAWGPMGRPALLTEDREILESDIDRHKFGYRMAEAEDALFAAHDEGAFRATYLAYPVVYGPWQPAPHEWCIVRRIRDGRRRIVVADGGVRLESRLFTEHAVHAVLLAVDQPEVTDGEKFVVTDDDVFSMRQRIEFVAAHMGVAVELVDMPYPVATPCHPYWRHGRQNRIRSNDKSRHVLHYADTHGAAEAMATTVDWLLDHPPAPGGQEESSLGDPFDYAQEDALMDEWNTLVGAVSVDVPTSEPAHPYRHPKAPGESWQRPSP